MYIGKNMLTRWPDKMVRTKWHWTKWYWTKWYG